MSDLSLLESSKYNELEKLECKMRDGADLPDTLIMSQLIRIADEIPLDINQISASYAQQLANRMYEGARLAIELKAIAERWELSREAHSKKERSIAQLVRAPQKGYKTVADRQAYIHLDESFLEAEMAANEAKVFRKAVEDNYDLFVRHHYFLRKVSETEESFKSVETQEIQPTGSAHDGWADILEGE